MNVSQRELELAFIRLQTSNYFDNYDLFLRERIALFKKDFQQQILQAKKILNDEKKLSKFIRNNIDIKVLPKKISTSHDIDKGFYTNTSIVDGTIVSKPFIWFDAPLIIHFISAIWIGRYGAIVDSSFSKNSLGNRLLLNSEEELASTRTVFKPYVNQFQKWWKKSIDKTKQLIDNGENATIINFDLESFYNKVDFSFNSIEEFLSKSYPNIYQDPMHIALKEIHIAYSELHSSRTNPEQKNNPIRLPIGLLTSHIFSNWHLKELDRFIEKKLRPVYYGRYVDDVLIVLKDTVIEKEEFSEIADNKILDYYIDNNLSLIFNRKGENLHLSLPGLKSLTLQKSKLFVYQFDANFSPNLIEKFKEEQKERASIFMFLSDEEDDNFDEFDQQTFESNFDNIDGNKARFKHIEDNKYRLSVFLSKLIKRRINRGNSYREEETAKILKYFKGYYLIKNYFFWEKLFTLLVVSGKNVELKKLVLDIEKEIEKISYKNESDTFQDIEFKKSLQKHLLLSLSMSLGLDVQMLNGKEFARQIYLSTIQKLNRELPRSSKRLSEEQFFLLKQIISLFRETGLCRGSFISLPLLQHTEIARRGSIKLYEFPNLDKLASSTTTKKLSKLLNIKNLDENYIPNRIKFWQAALFVFFKTCLTNDPGNTTNLRLHYTNAYSSFPILDEAFDLFFAINHPLKNGNNAFKERLKRKYFEQLQDSDYNEDLNQNLPREKNYIAREVFIQNGSKKNSKHEKIRVGIVNMYVDEKDYAKSLDGHPNNSDVRHEMFMRIWDQVGQIKDIDIACLPELSLPYKYLPDFIHQSSSKQIAFISGIEHLQLFRLGLNFVATVLPVTIDGDKDAIPVFRLKNHYAPDEEVWIRGKKLVVPKPKPYRYDLFIWRGLYFSTYYCYELADIHHRIAFFSKLDVLFAPVWNKDVSYYNSIIDSSTRDMHNYAVIVNTSQYGYSKIARPRDTVNKDKVIVKGGTEEGCQFNILVGDLKVRELREFQKLDFFAQKEKNKERKSFKPTPPDFPVENVEKRIENKSFFQ